jgi:hypothetical protein
VFTEDYLRQLAEAALPDPDSYDCEREIRKINAQIDRRSTEKVRLARKLAEEDGLDFIADAVTEIDSEIDDLQQDLIQLEQRRQAQVHRSTIEEQIEHTSKQMASKLDHLDDKEYAKLADLLQLDLERVGSKQFVGSASIPVPMDFGEVHESVPQHRGPHEPPATAAHSQKPPPTPHNLLGRDQPKKPIRVGHRSRSHCRPGTEAGSNSEAHVPKPK